MRRKTSSTEALRQLAARALSDESALDELAFALRLDGHLVPETDHDAHQSELERFRRLLALRGELRRQSGELTRAVLLARAARLFERHPALSSFGWRQATPTLLEDDGPGRLIAHTREPFLDGQAHARAPADAALAAAWHDVRALLGDLEHSALGVAFGDGNHITIARDGTVTDAHWWPEDY